MPKEHFNHRAVSFYYFVVTVFKMDSDGIYEHVDGLYLDLLTTGEVA